MVWPLLVAAALVVQVQVSLGMATEAEEMDPHTPVLLTWADKLRRDLLTHYDRNLRPFQHHHNVTVVSMGLAVTHVAVDEMESTVILNAWMRLSWQDDKLRWNESDYDGISVMHFAANEVWQPDILLYNSADHSEVDHYHSTHVLIYSSGAVLWVPPARFYAHCQLNLIRWPYDEHICQLRFGSWTHHGLQIDLEFRNNETKVDKMNFYTENMEWDLVDGEGEKNMAYYECCMEPYPEIVYKLHLRRRSPAYRAVVVVPGVVIGLVTLATFWLPPGAGEKVTIGCVNMILVTLFLLYFGNRLPAMGDHIPLVVLYYTNTLVLVGTSVGLSVLVLNLVRSRRHSPAPWVIKNIFTSCVGHALGLGHLIPLVSRTHKPLGVDGVELRSTEPLQDKEDSEAITAAPCPSSELFPMHNDWILIAAGIDRIAFLIYLLIIAILFALFL